MTKTLKRPLIYGSEEGFNAISPKGCGKKNKGILEKAIKGSINMFKHKYIREERSAAGYKGLGIKELSLR